MVYILLFVGVLLLLIGGDFLVKSSVALASKLNVSPFLIGVTVVSFGTSAPELIVSLNAAIQGNTGIAIGNVIGSNIANLGLVLGLTAVIKPMLFESKSYRLSWWVMLLSALMFIGFAYDGVLDRTDGMFFIAGLLVFITLTIRYRESGFTDEDTGEAVKSKMIPVYFLLGAAGLYFGSELLVDNAVVIAKSLGVSEFIIGITIVALGTSLPEFVTSIMAIIKGQTSISIGNLIGSNIFNVFAVLGITSIVQPMIANSFLFRFDLPVMFGISLLIGVFLFWSKKLSRVEGAILFSAYLFYVLYSLIA